MIRFLEKSLYVRAIQVLATGLFALTVSLPALAENPRCNIQTEVGKELAKQIESEGRIAEQTVRVIDEIRTLLGSRTWKEHTPMSEQMTPTESARFGSLQEKMKSMSLPQIIESKRTRDVRVIARMARLADQTARYGLELPDDTNSEDYFLLMLISAIRQTMPVDLDKLSKSERTGECSLERALSSEALNVANEATKVPGSAEASVRLEELVAKYKKPLDAKKMNALDRRNFEQELLPIIREAQAKFNLAEDLGRLARLEVVSKIMLEAMRQDQYEAPGDIQHSGKTWNSWVKDGRITQEQNEDAGVISMINEKIPCDFIKQLDALEKQRPFPE